MMTLMQDVRYALRQLRKTPGFTFTAILTLSLGLGANAAIFTLVNAVLLKSLPVVNPKTLVRIGDQDQCCINSGAHDDGDYALFSTDTYQHFKQMPEFEDLAAMQAGFNYSGITTRRDGNGNLAHPSMGEFVSGNYFRTFGLQPQAGRLFADADDVKGAPMVAVMSYECWKTTYNGDPSVIGSTFWVNTRPVTLVGIAPQGFYGDRLASSPPDFFLPMVQVEPLENADYYNNPDGRWLYFIGRLKPNVDRGALQAKLGSILKQLFAPSKIFSSAHDQPLLQKVHVVLTDGGAGIQAMQNGYSSQLKLLMWISGLVLLIACANIANLLLVRGMSRKSEMAVRSALGAARSRIVRQLLTESLLLALISGAAALIVSYAGSKLLLTLAFPGEQHVPISSSPSLEVLGFAVALSVVTGILFGVAPALISSNAKPADALRGTRSTTGGASLLQRGLVVAQAGLSLVLLVGAGLFAQNLGKLEHMDMKLDPANRYIVHINPQAAGYLPSQMEAVYRTIEERFHSVPGIVKVGLATYSPMEDNNWGMGVQIEGKERLNIPSPSFVKATPEYFDSVGTKVVMGRGIGVQDVYSAPAVAVVNQTFVKKFFSPGENPIGQHFGRPGPDTTGDYLIVGVVEDTAYSSVKWKDHAMFFLPITQRPAGTPAKFPLEKDTSFYAGALVLQTSHPMDNMESIARSTLSSINPNLTIVKFQTFDQQIADRFTQDRMISRLMTLFGGLALLLATVGLYGVTSYTVARRTSEIGIRMALGAERSGVVIMVLRSALLQTMFGLALGVPIAYYCVRFVKSQLYEMTAVNPAALSIAVVTLLAAAFVAGLIPGRRAASIDPAKALRSE